MKQQTFEISSCFIFFESLSCSFIERQIQDSTERKKLFFYLDNLSLINFYHSLKCLPFIKEHEKKKLREEIKEK